MKTHGAKFGRAGLAIAAVAALGLTVGTAPARSAETRAGASVAIIFDASNSMNDPLLGNERRIDAAKGAVIRLISGLDPDLQIALHSFGHRFPHDQNNCRDTEQLVSFGRADDVRDNMIGRIKALKAQGAAPITRAIAEAANSIGQQDSEKRIVVLVSDGTESCRGDPCETARALANDDPRLIVHTIGIGVNLVAEKQLLCIARAAGGQYFEARDAASLERALRKVAAPRQTISLPSETGQIILRNADLVEQSFAPVDAESGEPVDGVTLAGGDASAVVAAGTYSIAFGAGVAIDGIIVRKGGKTIVDPAVLEVHNVGGAALVFKAGEATPVGATSTPGADGTSFMLLAPGTYDVSADGSVWKGFNLSAGRRTVIDGARLTIKASPGKVFQIKTPTGAAIGEIASGGGLTLLGGTYVVSNGDAATTFDIKPGQQLTLEMP